MCVRDGVCAFVTLRLCVRVCVRVNAYECVYVRACKYARVRECVCVCARARADLWFVRRGCSASVRSGQQEADAVERRWRRSLPHWPAAATARLHTCTAEWAGSHFSPSPDKDRQSETE